MADLLIKGLSVAGISRCHLRRSSRARRIRIELRPDRSLLVVVPSGIREDQWLAFVLSKKHWIELNLQRLAPQQSDLQSRVAGFPSELELLCTGQKFQTCRLPGSRNRAMLVQDNLNLVCVRSSDKQAYQVLRRWLIARARKEFSARLERISSTTKLGWTGLSIRGQKTRWGSCSAKGHISLNFKMLFLPSNLVDHVLLHELVHTRELNHSHRFWGLMKKFDPDCSQHRADLKKAGQLLPDWMAHI
jgi:predicted metal-dependent hydrolase